MVFPFSAEPLFSDRLVLSPVQIQDSDELCACLLEEKNGWFAVRFGVNSVEAIRSWVEESVVRNEKRSRLTYAIRHRTAGTLFGVTQYYSLVSGSNKVEIGGTQIGIRFRATYINAESKYLLIQNAFERQNFSGVVFKVDPENARSICAIETLGAKYAGLEKDSYTDISGYKRDNLIYEIEKSDWFRKCKSSLISRIHARLEV